MILLGSGDGQALLGQQIVVALGNAFQRSCYDKIPDPNAHRNTGVAVFARGFVNNALAAAKSGFHQRFVQTSGIAANQWRVHFSLNAVFQIGAGPRGRGKKLVKDFVWTRQKSAYRMSGGSAGELRNRVRLMRWFFGKNGSSGVSSSVSSLPTMTPKHVVLVQKINDLATFSRSAQDMHGESGFGQFGHHCAPAFLVAAFDH